MLGQRIGRYEVLGHLASGGMGQVYLARATGLGGFQREVVVKTLEVGEADDEALVTMFLDEARLVGALHHQYIAPVYEVGCDGDGRYFLVMDYVRGETVETVWRASLDANKALSLGFALTTVAAVAAALEYAHAVRGVDGTPLEVVHRDVSLSNVMIGYDGAVKLIDFGIAKAAGRATKTQVGTLKGKIGYVSPEQILHHRVDRRADIFALGIVLYELTTMTRAFRDTSDLNTLERITKGEIVPPSQLVADYPRKLERVVMRALSVDPDQRFQEAGTMGRELEGIAHELGIALGHTAIARVMDRLFDQAMPYPRRRFARASDSVSTQDVPQLVDDNLTVPVEAGQLLEPRIIPESESTDVELAMPAPLVVRITTPALRPPSVTAEIVRPVMTGTATLGRRYDWSTIMTVAIAVLLVVAIVFAIVR